MKADLYVQGRFWATVIVPADSLLALLAKGIIANADQLATRLQDEPFNLANAQCSISIRVAEPVTSQPPQGD